MVAPREMFTELGGWTPSCYLEDWDLWRRAIYAGWEAVGHALVRDGIRAVRRKRS